MVPLHAPAAPQRVASTRFTRVTASRRRSARDLTEPDATLRDRRDLLAARPRLRSARAFCLSVNLEDTGLRSATFAGRLLRQAGVTTSSSVGFGPRGEGYVRPSSAAPRAEPERGTTRIHGALRRPSEASC